MMYLIHILFFAWWMERLINRKREPWRTCYSYVTTEHNHG